MALLFWMFLILAVTAILFKIWGNVFSSDRKADEIHFIRTSDNFPVALHRYLPRTKGKGLLPVILCHGLGANRFNLDLDDRRSLAVQLAKEGYDVFLIELRGIGRSHHLRWFFPGKWDICFDDFVQKDIPAAVDYVLSQTGQKKLHWVGHSMGGMVAYAFCQFDIASKIKSVCTVASPGHLKGVQKAFMPMIRFLFLIKPFQVVHQVWFGKFFAPFLPYLKRGPIPKTLYQRENMAPDVLRTAASNLLSDTPSKLLSQFADWVRLGDIFSLEGYSYRANYNKVKVPFCLLSAEKDFFVSYNAVRSVYDAISSIDKKHIHFSKDEGTTDYGHGDIMLGEPALLEVHPVIIRWIEEHS